MKKFYFKIKPDYRSPDSTWSDEKFEQLMSLERHFTIAYVCVEQKVEQSRLMDVFERYGGRLINLELEFENLTYQVLLTLLQKVPKLQKLKLCGNRHPDDRTVGSVTLKKLKKLVLRCDFDPFQLIDTPALITLSTSDDIFNPESLEENSGEMETSFAFKLKQFCCYSRSTRNFSCHNLEYRGSMRSVTTQDFTKSFCRNSKG